MFCVGFLSYANYLFKNIIYTSADKLNVDGAVQHL